MRWGIIDVSDGTWIGNDAGPVTFDEAKFDPPQLAKEMAQAAAQVAETQVYGTDLGCKYQVREFPETRMRKKEDIATRMGSLAALRRIEGGKD